jgi:hypothetical protein
LKFIRARTGIYTIEKEDLGITGGCIVMTFDQWLLEVKGLTWEQYLGLFDEEQDKLSDEYEKETQNWK